MIEIDKLLYLSIVAIIAAGIKLRRSGIRSRLMKVRSKKCGGIVVRTTLTIGGSKEACAFLACVWLFLVNGLMVMNCRFVSPC
ncbi:hypothetical protein F5Y02DRAFT_320313 [Annulohypoxylon stygium]|nr:hypothetical protein F5Y02DRAFT_320313 [Annulohypoxylon stygium]